MPRGFLACDAGHSPAADCITGQPNVDFLASFSALMLALGTMLFKRTLE